MTEQKWLTKDDLDAAQALVDAATPGSWIAYQESFVSSAEGPVAVITDRLPSDTPATADAEFIAQSRTLVPALLHRIRFQHDKAIRAQEFWEGKIRGLERAVDQYRFMHSSRCAEVERTKAKLARVEDVLGEYLDPEDADIECREDVWRFIRDLRSALKGDQS